MKSIQSSMKPTKKQISKFIKRYSMNDAEKSLFAAELRKLLRAGVTESAMLKAWRKAT